MKSLPLILIGGGGHCISCIDVIESSGRFHIVGILDPHKPIRSKVLKYEIIGVDEDIIKHVPVCENYFITIGHVKEPQARISSFQKLKNMGITLPAIVAKNAYQSPYSEIGEGTIVMHKAFVNADARIGMNCIINTGAVIEHGSVIGNHTHISTGAYVNGDCRIGARVFIGSSAVISNGITVGNDIVIGAGAVVIRSLTQPGVYAGNPARKIA